MHIIIVMELWKFPKLDEEYALYYREKKNNESESVAFFVAEWVEGRGVHGHHATVLIVAAPAGTVQCQAAT